MWHMTALAPNADFSFFAWARIYQTIGLPFLFIPISTASYAGLAPEQTNQASALINVRAISAAASASPSRLLN